MFPTGGEAETSTAKERQKKSKTVQISPYAEVVDPFFLKLPTVYPLAIIGRTFLTAREVDGSVHCDEVIHHVESMNEVEKTDKECLWIFKEVIGYRNNGQTWDVKMKWEDDSEAWKPLA
eukprot:3520845-Ditylum_brightwellii.AAC.1